MRPARPVCDRCGYELSGLVTGDHALCPECGTPNTLDQGHVQRRSWPTLAYLAVITWPVLPLGLLVARYNQLVSHEIAKFGSPMNQSEAWEPVLFKLAQLCGAWVLASMLGVALAAVTRPAGPQRARALLALIAALPGAAALLVLPTLIGQLLVG